MCRADVAHQPQQGLHLIHSLGINGNAPGARGEVVLVVLACMHSMQPTVTALLCQRATRLSGAWRKTSPKVEHVQHQRATAKGVSRGKLICLKRCVDQLLGCQAAGG